EIQDRLQSLSRRARVDGFRPGKAPLKLIKQMYGDQVRYEAVSELMERSLHEALLQEKLSPLGGPKIEPKPLEEGQDLEYCATFEVVPEFELAGFENITVERPVAEVTEQDIDAMIETLREQRTTWIAVERMAREGDRVWIDFSGQIDGQDFPGGKGENTAVVLGKSAMPKDFEDRLVGLSADAEIEFDMMFPDGYHIEDVTGKTARFHVKLHAVEEASLPEVDEAFAESFDVKEGGIAGLRRSLRDNMERELRDGIKTRVKRQVMQGLLDANDIPLPQALIRFEIENLARQLHFPAGGDDERIRDLKAQLLGSEARRRVALGLLVSRLAADQGIQVDTQRVQAYLQSLAATYQEPAEVLRWYEQTPQALDGVRALVLEDQIVDWLLERVRVTDKSSAFAEIMTPGKQPAGSAVHQELSE
ncbi:MAG: trigger factor, partial [Candidatus Competibacter sp.]|nr:trigger factor [Candidatus Competibacter sp.]